MILQPNSLARPGGQVPYAKEPSIHFQIRQIGHRLAAALEREKELVAGREYRKSRRNAVTAERINTLGEVMAFTSLGA